jgi:hypothetical protein
MLLAGARKPRAAARTPPMNDDDVALRAHEREQSADGAGG